MAWYFESMPSAKGKPRTADRLSIHIPCVVRPAPAAPPSPSPSLPSPLNHPCQNAWSAANRLARLLSNGSQAHILMLRGPPGGRPLALGRLSSCLQPLSRIFLSIPNTPLSPVSLLDLNPDASVAVVLCCC